MTADEFVSLVGETLIHVAARANLPRIEAGGLSSAADLARAAGVDPRTLALRRDRRVLQTPGGPATLNHQLPLRAGAHQAPKFLEDHSLMSWAEQLDERIFFWPSKASLAFEDSIDIPTAQLHLNARALFAARTHALFLSPINSGSATRRAARRGDWLYVPATATPQQFKDNRRARGLTRTTDKVVEVSLRTSLPPDLLHQVRL